MANLLDLHIIPIAHRGVLLRHDLLVDARDDAVGRNPIRPQQRFHRLPRAHFQLFRSAHLVEKHRLRHAPAPSKLQ